MKRVVVVAAALVCAAAAPAQARDYVGLVNPWVEADIGRYFFFQSASSPFGFVKLRRDTSTHAVIDPDAIRENAALWPGVTAQASSVFSSAFGAERVHDGFGAGSADWASAGDTNPWVELRWSSPVAADRVVLFDRTSGDDANGGVLQFGDGSTVEVTGIPGNGSGETVSFSARTFDRLRFHVQGGSGPNVGLLELEVYARP